MKQKNLKLMSALGFITGLLYLPITLIGLILYFASELIRALAYLLLWKRKLAKIEIKEFWRINS